MKKLLFTLFIFIVANITFGQSYERYDDWAIGYEFSDTVIIADKTELEALIVNGGIQLVSNTLYLINKGEDYTGLSDSVRFELGSGDNHIKVATYGTGGIVEMEKPGLDVATYNPYWITVGLSNEVIFDSISFVYTHEMFRDTLTNSSQNPQCNNETFVAFTEDDINNYSFTNCRFDNGTSIFGFNNRLMDSLFIYNCYLGKVYLDHIFGNITMFLMDECYIEKANWAWHLTTHNTDDDRAAGGDDIQLGSNLERCRIYNTTFDRSHTGNKFAIIWSGATEKFTDALIDIEGCTFIPPKDTAGVGFPSFTGTMDDLIFDEDGRYNYGNRISWYSDTTWNYVVEIDGTGTPDTYRWSEDDGVSWEFEGIPIIDEDTLVMIDSNWTGEVWNTRNREVIISFTNTTGHTGNEVWEFDASTDWINDGGNVFGSYITTAIVTEFFSLDSITASLVEFVHGTQSVGDSLYFITGEGGSVAGRTIVSIGAWPYNMKLSAALPSVDYDTIMNINRNYAYKRTLNITRSFFSGRVTSEGNLPNGVMGNVEVDTVRYNYNIADSARGYGFMGGGQYAEMLNNTIIGQINPTQYSLFYISGFTTLSVARNNLAAGHYETNPIAFQGATVTQSNNIQQNSGTQSSYNSALSITDWVTSDYMRTSNLNDGYDVELPYDFNGNSVGTLPEIGAVEFIVPPDAGFLFSDLTPVVGLPYYGFDTTSFDATSNNPGTWLWTFDPSVTYINGTTSASQNPYVEFTSTGDHTITLYTTNDGGNDTEIRTDYVEAKAKTAFVDTYYIDPDEASSGDGSIGSPWTSLKDAEPFQDNTQYKVNRGTSHIVTSSIKPGTTVNVEISDYGTGALPIVTRDGSDVFHVEGTDYFTIRNINIAATGWSTAAGGGINMQANGEKPLHHPLIDSCIISYAGTGIRWQAFGDSCWYNPISGWRDSILKGEIDSITITNTIIKNIEEDAIFGKESRWTRIMYDSIYDYNWNWYLVGHKQNEAGGDGIQEVSGYQSQYNYNYISGQNVGNKFLILYSRETAIMPGNWVEIIGNHLTPAKDTLAIYDATFTGTTDDLTFRNRYYFPKSGDNSGPGDSTWNYVVEIDGTDPDTYQLSLDGGSTWEYTDEAITAGVQQQLRNTYNSYGEILDLDIDVTFGSSTTHDLGDRWEFIGTSLLDDHGGALIGVSAGTERLTFTHNYINGRGFGVGEHHQSIWNDYPDSVFVHYNIYDSIQTMEAIGEIRANDYLSFWNNTIVSDHGQLERLTLTAPYKTIRNNSVAGYVPSSGSPFLSVGSPDVYDYNEEIQDNISSTYDSRLGIVDWETSDFHRTWNANDGVDVGLLYDYDGVAVGVVPEIGALEYTDSEDPPVAEFSVDNQTPYVNENVEFTDLSTNIPTSWLWEFNPTTITYHGTTNGSQNPIVSFDAIGTYQVTLTATNLNGNDSEVKVGYIVVSVAPDVFIYIKGGNVFKYGNDLIIK